MILFIFAVSFKIKEPMKRKLAMFLLFGGMLCPQFTTARTETSNPPEDRSLDEVVVTGTRDETDAAQLPATVSVIGRRQIEQADMPSLLPILTEQVPGLFVSSRGIMGYGVSGGAAGEISLRGISGSSGRLMTLIDGHPQYMGLMGHPIADACQSLMAEKVEVLRGPASVLYGSNAMGGVVNIITRKMRTEGMSTHAHVGYGSYNTLQTEITNRVRKGRFTGIVSTSYNRTDGHRDDMDFEQYAGYAKFGYELSARWKAEADVNVTHFNASQPGETGQPLLDADQNVTRGMTSLALENRYEKTSGRLGFFHNWGRHKINDGYAPGEGEGPLAYRFNSRDGMTGVQWYQNARLFRGNLLTTGIDWYHFGGEAWNKFVEGPREGERDDIVDKKQDEVAGYVDLRQRIGPRATLNAGLRVDHHSQAGTEWIPQAGLAFQAPKDIEIKLTAGKGFRHPLIREMFMWGAANPDLEAESMWNYEFAFSQRLLDSRLTYGFNVFYINGKNMIATVSADGRMKNVNTGRIENAGLEMQAACRISKAWSADANYSFLHMGHPVVTAPENKLYAGVSFSKGKWMLTSGVQYVKGLYTELGTNGDGDETKEDFVLWNVRGTFRATRDLAFWLRGENLLAQRYEIMSGYPMPRATVMGGVNIEF